MAKVKRIQCKGKTKAGKQCQRKAVRDGEYCDVHGGEKELPSWLYETPKQNARAHTIPPHNEENFSASFVELLDICRREGANPTDNSTKVQWVQIHHRILVSALEHQRLMDGLGAGVQHMFVLEHPKGDKPKPPADNGRQSEDEPERVIH